MAWIVIIGVLMMRIGTSITVPFIAIFLYFKVGLALSMIGVIIGVSYLSYSLGGFWGGFLSDRYGRKTILKISLLCYGFVFWGFALSAYLLDLSQNIIIVAFIILNTLAGFFKNWADTLTQTILGDVTIDGEEKVLAFSCYYTFINIGNALGPVLGAWIGASGTTDGFYYTAVMCWAYLFIFIWFDKQQTMSSIAIVCSGNSGISLKASVQILLGDKILRFYTIGGIVAYFAYVQQEAILGTVLMQRFGDTEVFAIVLSVNAIIAFSLQMPLTRYLLKNYSPLILMRNGCIFLAVGLAGLGFSGDSLATYIISQVVFTLGEIFVLSIGGIFIDDIAPPAYKGTYFGVLGFQKLGKCLGPVLGGFLLQYFDGSWVLTFIGFISLSAMFFYHKSLRLYRENKAYL